MSENAIKPRWLIALALEVPRGVYREIEDRLREELAPAHDCSDGVCGMGDRK